MPTGEIGKSELVSTSEIWCERAPAIPSARGSLNVVSRRRDESLFESARALQPRFAARDGAPMGTS